MKLSVAYDFADGKRVEFSGPEPLGADDLRVLQGLVAMAGPRGQELPAAPCSDIGRALRAQLNLSGAATNADALVVRGSFRELAREIGLASLDDTVTIRRCVERLWKVSVIAQSGSVRRGYNLLSGYVSDAAGGRLNVALNPQIAEAVLGCGQHTRIDLAEVRALRGDAARLVHQRLCGWINPGKSGRVGLDALMHYAWPDPAGVETNKKRKQRLRRALAELSGLGWRVHEYVAEKFEISRPRPTITVPNHHDNCPKNI